MYFFKKRHTCKNAEYDSKFSVKLAHLTIGPSSIYACPMPINIILGDSNNIWKILHNKLKTVFCQKDWSETFSENAYISLDR